jgi:hypothetical protein
MSGLRTWAGLQPLVQAVLKRAGHQLRHTNSAANAWPEPDESQLKAFQDRDHSWLAAVKRHDRALVLIDKDQVKPALLAAQVALAWPEKTVTVAVARIEDARQLGRELSAYVPDTLVITSRNSSCRPARVRVATYAYLDSTAGDAAWFDVVICANALEALGESPRKFLCRAMRARLYGFIDRDGQPAPLERDLLACLFGFQQVVIPKHGSTERPVQLARCKVAGGPALSKQLDLLELKRQAIWHHPVRNRRVARIAKLLQNGRWAEFQQLLRHNRPTYAQPVAPVGMGNPTVLIFVENVEHAMVLARLLPDSVLRCGSDVCHTGGPLGQTGMLQPGPFTTNAATITTAMGLKEFDVGQIDVIIRADGGEGLLPLSRNSLIQPASEPAHPLLLVDFNDRHHPLFRRRSRQREKAYWKRGWCPAGLDPVMAKVAEFLARRPKGVAS